MQLHVVLLFKMFFFNQEVIHAFFKLTKTILYNMYSAKYISKNVNACRIYDQMKQFNSVRKQLIIKHHISLLSLLCKSNWNNAFLVEAVSSYKLGNFKNDYLKLKVEMSFFNWCIKKTYIIFLEITNNAFNYITFSS